jgi:hypothetical protein
MELALVVVDILVGPGPFRLLGQLLAVLAPLEELLSQLSFVVLAPIFGASGELA